MTTVSLTVTVEVESYAGEASVTEIAKCLRWHLNNAAPGTIFPNDHSEYDVKAWVPEAVLPEPAPSERHLTLVGAGFCPEHLGTLSYS